jgi:Zn-dependent M28 family amino/carboxypeptidase
MGKKVNLNSIDDSVKRFINLDAMGSSGRELMFRASPSSLVTQYGVVPRPHANVIGEDIVQFIPSDTDFSAYTNVSRWSSGPWNPNYYKLDGFDIALVSYGYYYHTLKDDIHAITEGTLQHIGDNALALLVNAAYESDFNLKDDFQYVYFDVYGKLF